MSLSARALAIGIAAYSGRFIKGSLYHFPGAQDGLNELVSFVVTFEDLFSDVAYIHESVHKRVKKITLAVNRRVMSCIILYSTPFVNPESNSLENMHQNDRK